MKRLVGSVCVVAVLLATGPSRTARANLIANGDFEAWADTDAPPDDWLENAPAFFEQAVGLDGSGNSLQVNPGTTSARGIYQSFDPLDRFEISLEFAAEDPGVADSSHRSFRATLRGGGGIPGTPIANIRVIGNGDLQMFDGSWTTVPGGAGAITFSDFVANDPTVYRLTLSGVVNTGDSGTLGQSIRLFDVTNGSVLVDEDLGNGLWQTTPTSLPLVRIFFESTGALEASYRVDNVSVFVPEPHSLISFGLALVGFSMLRRRTQIGNGEDFFHGPSQV